MRKSPAEPPKVRINIMIKPDLLKRVDDAAGKFERSAFIGDACKEKLENTEQK